MATTTLAGKTLFITGGSRGIGRAIALCAAADGANVALVAKTDTPHPKLPGTVHSVAAEVGAAGGLALPLVVDIRDEQAVERAVAATVGAFGGIDILVNNASAIHLATTPETPLKRYDLMMGINARGTFACTQACLPHLRRAENPHILVLSPPVNLNPRWFKAHTAYTVAKYCMSLYVLGWAEEFRDDGIAVNALWPRTVIDTAAARLLGVTPEQCRRDSIMSDAAHAILTRDSRSCTGNFFIDDEVLRTEGVTNPDAYNVVPGSRPYPDLFLD